MDGELAFWAFIVVFSLLMLAGFFLLDRPRKSGAVRTRRQPAVDAAARQDPRGRHPLADRADPRSGDRI